MTITHPSGLYTIKVDTSRKLVSEAPVGLWTKEQYQEYHSQYENKVAPLVAKEPWAILCDMRKYKISDLGDVLAKHAEWLENNNCKLTAMIVDSAIVKMQINRAVSGKIAQQAFTTEEEADAWLKTKGF